MPRNASGTYTLPAGNPVVSGNIIEAAWANSTMSDMATELTNSLSRSGAGGMTGAFRAADGSSSVPGIAFGAETTTGFYRASTNDVRFVIATNELQRWTASGTAITGTLSVSGAATFTGTTATFVNATAYYPQIVNRNTTNDANGAYIAIEKARDTSVVQNGDILGNIVFRGYDGASYLQGAAIWSRVSATPGTNDMPSSLVFGTTPDGASGVTERAVLDHNGNLGIGTSSPRGDLDVGTVTATAITKSIHIGFSQADFYGFRIANTNTASLNYAGTLAFQRGNGAAWADVVTITDGGNLLINTATIAGNGGYTFQVQAGGIAVVNNNDSASTGYVFSSYRRGGTEIGSVTQNGTTAVLYNTTSDRRLKDNIVPAPSASDVIDAIQIVSHDWKAAFDEHVTYGVIAQDLHAVAPQAVLQGDDGDEIEMTWGVDYSKLVPMLIKEIQSLRARVAALEAA
jgi:hypothetical protein